MDHAEEERRVRTLRLTVDLLLRAIAVQPGLSRESALEMMDQARGLAVRLFPNKGETFDLLYAPRFERAIRERFGPGPVS